MDLSDKLITLNTDLETIKNEVDEQADLIAQIQAALQNKAAGAGDSLAATLISGTIPRCTNNSVEKVRPYAFYGCSSLTAVTFPQCTAIGDHAFYGCSAVVTASFGGCNIGDYAFTDCINLEEILINSYYGASLSFGNNAFSECSSLNTVIINCSKKCDLGNTLTDLVASGGCNLYVPRDLIAVYHAAVDMYGQGILALEDLPGTSVFYGTFEAASQAAELAEDIES